MKFDNQRNMMHSSINFKFYKIFWIGVLFGEESIEYIIIEDIIQVKYIEKACMLH